MPVQWAIKYFVITENYNLNIFLCTPTFITSAAKEEEDRKYVKVKYKGEKLHFVINESKKKK